MVFQSYALYPNMTVGQNIVFGLEMRGVPKAERDKAMGEVAKLLQIDHLLDRKPGQLSGGQRQRVAMGRALVRHPKIFLFDEPLSNLDAKLRVEMRTEIKKLHQRLKATIVYVTHDQIEAMTLATRIAVMKAGELLQLGTPKEIYENPADLFVAGFMGSPSMNLIPAKLVRPERRPRGRDRARRGRPGHPAAGRRQRRLGGLCRPGRDPGRAAGAHQRSRRNAEAQGPDAARLDALVEVTEPTGPDTLAVMMLGGVEATARLRADTKARPGELSSFMVDMTKVCLFDPKTRAPDRVMTGLARRPGDRLGHRRRHHRRRARRQRCPRHDPRARRAAARQLRALATPRPSSSTSATGRRRRGATGGATSSTPATTTMSAATRNSTARCMLRYRERDFDALEHADGVSPAWPIAYADLEPWYGRAERLFQVRGAAGRGSDRAAAIRPTIRIGPVPDEPAIAARAGAADKRKACGRSRCRWRSTSTAGCAVPLRHGTPFPTPAAASSTPRRQPWPRRCAARTSRWSPARIVERLLVAPDGRRIEGVEYRQGGERRDAPSRHGRARGRRRQLGRPAAALGHGRHPDGLANRSGVVGRHFMNHNCTAMLAVDPRARNDSVYQKTLGINDFYFDDGRGGPPLGNVQLLGKITAPILQANARWAPGFALVLARAPQRRLVPDERGPARSREPGPRRRRDHRPATGVGPT